MVSSLPRPLKSNHLKSAGIGRDNAQAVSDTLWDYVAAQTVEQAMPLERLDIVDCDDARHAVSNTNPNGLTRSEVATFSYLPTGRSWNVSHHIAALRGLAINLALGRDR